MKNFEVEETIKRNQLRKYQILCAVLAVCLVVMSLGLGLGLGLRQNPGELREAPALVSCRNRCHEPLNGNQKNCRCDQKCTLFENCCWDFEDICLKPTQLWTCSRLRCGEKRLAGSHCFCSDDCLSKGDCCADYKSVCKGDTPWVKDKCEPIIQPQCPKGFNLPPVILFSMDGFRAEYLQTWGSLMPNIEKLKTCGTHSKYMRAAYPTKTFPNHYTIVTGLYPESSGIIDNNMYDVKLNKSFSLSGNEKFNRTWWNGQPIWLTAMYQGLKAGTFFWPGSDVPINGSYPTLYKMFDKSIVFEERVLQVLKWLDLPKTERPDFYTLYIEQPDSAGHAFGPVSGGVIQALQLADRTIGMLMDGLKQRNLHNCVNLIIVADHGMEKTFCEKLEYMTNYFNEINFYMYDGPAARIRSKNVPQDYFKFDSAGIVKNLTCRKPNQHFKPYLTPDLPKRFHYANNIRIDKVHLYVDRQWLAVRDNTYTFCGGGNHGYDNEFKSMEAIFIAHGPSFKNGTEVEPFENIEIYNLICENKANAFILPYGRPRVLQKSSTYCLLYHHDYVNGYSQDIRMPLWSAYTIEKQIDALPPTIPDCLRADVRIPSAQSQKCSDYKSDLNITHGFLYPPNYNKSELGQYDALISSNIVPMYNEFKRIWNYFHGTLLPKYANEKNGLNVVSGPVFDYNYDGHFDSLYEIKQNLTNLQIPIPTHYFIVLTSCKNSSSIPVVCPGFLDVQSFLIPHRSDNSESCADGGKPESQWVEERLKAHAARVKDVELLTGLDFYQNREQPITEILQLKTFLPTFETIIN
ncbi:ectonucleotide pyrophosphatase/phosphodiesterase family member 3 isoform X5 [Rhinatrema bivittatum]|uniref:ectonucleotide pyrophosphatase/phosphodiesterase family member 3 isoform X5 n=1 Tax=Rhinatrema bivittatum TaxID=194408 RepID=UPI00112BA33B|nr:ectonucleotide pyrophosphatase/phosphodiesterase family member 3 isoform X5 [Rhinatrema bivittatum]